MKPTLLSELCDVVSNLHSSKQITKDFAKNWANHLYGAIQIYKNDEIIYIILINRTEPRPRGHVYKCVGGKETDETNIDYEQLIDLLRIIRYWSKTLKIMEEVSWE